MKKFKAAVFFLGVSTVFFIHQGSAMAGSCSKKATPALLESGKKVYSINCTTCHGEKGDGNGPAGAMLNPKPRNFISDVFKKGDKPEQVLKSVSEGLAGTAMPGFAYLSEEDRCAATHYILSLRKKK